MDIEVLIQRGFREQKDNAAGYIYVKETPTAYMTYSPVYKQARDRFGFNIIRNVETLEQLEKAYFDLTGETL